MSQYNFEDQFTYYGTDPMQRRIHMQQRAELITDMFGKKPKDYKEWGNTEGGGFSYGKTWGMSLIGLGLMTVGTIATPLGGLGLPLAVAGVVIAGIGGYNSYQEDKRMQDGYEKYLYKMSNEARAEFEARIRNQAPAQAPSQAPVIPPEQVVATQSAAVAEPAASNQSKKSDGAAMSEQSTVPTSNSFAAKEAPPTANFAEQAMMDKTKQGVMTR